MSKSEPAVSLTPQNLNFSNNYLDFLGEYEAICETALAPESGPKGESPSISVGYVQSWSWKGLSVTDYSVMAEL
jgi:hypothetical protein